MTDNANPGPLDLQRGMSAITRRGFLGRSAGLGVAALATSSFAAACGSASSGTAAVSGKPIRGGQLRTAHAGGGSTETLVPFTENPYIDTARHMQLYEHLYQRDRNLVPQPLLAESLEPNADATVWKLTIKSGIQFHSGKPLTADDVIYSWQEGSKPQYGSSSDLTPLNLHATKKLSDHEVEIHLKQPIGDMEGFLSKQLLYIIPVGLIDFNKPDGTGPFKFVSWTPGVRSLFTRNEHYWQPGKPYVDSVEMLSISDPVARLNALLGGEVDAMEQLGFEQAKTNASSSQMSILQSPAPVNVPMTMRLDTPPFNDVRVREAFRLAAQRPQLVDNVYVGYGTLGNDLMGKGYPSYNGDLPQRAYDPEKAKSLLKAAGHDGITVTLPTSQNSPGMEESATVFKQQAVAAGITVNLRVIPAADYFNAGNYNSKSNPFYQSAWLNSFEDFAPLALFKSGPFNETAWDDPSWEAAFLKAQGIIDPTARDNAYKALQVPLYDRGGYIIWGFSNLVDGISTRLAGVVPSPIYYLGDYQFKDWWFRA